MPLPNNLSQTRSSIFRTLGVACIIIALCLVAFSLTKYRIHNETQTTGLLCFDDGHCEQDMNYHVNIRLYVCETYVGFPEESGNIEGHHTHKASNEIHWVQAVPVNPDTKLPLKTLDRTLQALLKDMSYSLPKTCRGSSAITTVTVNGAENSLGLDATWEDGDIVLISHN